MPGRVLLGLLLVLCSLAGLGVRTAHAEPVTISTDVVSLGPHMALLDDADRTATQELVLSGALDDRFRTTAREAPTVARAERPYWARLTLRNDGPMAVERWLVFANPYYGTLSLFLPDGAGGWIERRLTKGEAKRDTDRPDRHPMFRLNLPPGESTFYIRVEHYFVTFAAELRTEEAQAMLTGRDALWQGIAFGILVIVVAYQLAILVLVRDGPGWPILVFALAVLGFIYVQLGYPWLHLGDRWAGYSFYIGAGPVPMIAGFYFSRTFLLLKDRMPWADRALMVNEIALALVTFWAVPAVGAGLSQVLALTGCVLSLVTATRLAGRHGEARYYLLGFFTVIVAGFIWALRMAGVLPVALWTEATLYLGNAIGMVLLTFGVADQIGRQRTEREARLAASEQALRDANERLEERVAARTGELARTVELLQQSQSALVQAEKMASLGQLVAGISHEINTPVGIAVTAASHLLDETERVEATFQQGALKRSALETFLMEARNAARMVLNNTRRAADLVQSFKNVAVDQASEERRTFELGELVGEVVTSLSPHMRRCGHTVVVTGGDAPVRMTTYPGAIGRTLTNLVMNATVHAFEPGTTGGRIIIDLAAGPDTVRLRVSDNGKGIPPDIQGRIFDPFFTTRRGSGGTGLGLHIVFNLVTEQLRGRITMASSPGEGTSFTVTIPRIVAEPSPAEDGRTTGRMAERLTAR